MKTNDFVNLLAAGIEPVDHAAPLRRMQAALLAGLVGATLVMLLIYGLRADLGHAATLPMFWLKLAFPTALAIAAGVMTWRAGHPGVQLGWAWLGVATPWLMLSVAAVWVLMDSAPGSASSMLLGKTWTSCAFNIALVSVPVFVGSFWALRGMAPTQPTVAGACAGLMSAAVGTAVYCLHCPEMQLPFLAVWYVLGMAIPTGLGALLGPRLLRW